MLGEYCYYAGFPEKLSAGWEGAASPAEFPRVIPGNRASRMIRESENLPGQK